MNYFLQHTFSSEKIFKSRLFNKKVCYGLIFAYILAVLGFSVTSRADIKINPFPSKNTVYTQSFVGDLVSDLDGKHYLIVSDTLYFELISKDINLEYFNGHKVAVKVLDAVRKSGPVKNLMSIDLDNGVSDKNEAPILFVLDIREIVE